MKKTLLVLTAFAVCAGYASAQATATTALSVLTKRVPGVKWVEKSLIKGDFDYDGTIDYALRGRQGKFFVLGIVKGAVGAKSKHWTMQFGEDAGDQGSLCSVKSAVITVTDLDKDYVEFAAEYLEEDFAARLKKLPTGSKGINVSDGMCDSFHVLWDGRSKQFIWWRL